MSDRIIIDAMDYAIRISTKPFLVHNTILLELLNTIQNKAMTHGKLRFGYSENLSVPHASMKAFAKQIFPLQLAM